MQKSTKDLSLTEALKLVRKSCQNSTITELPDGLFEATHIIAGKSRTKILTPRELIKWAQYITPYGKWKYWKDNKARRIVKNLEKGGRAFVRIVVQRLAGDPDTDKDFIPVHQVDIWCYD